MSAPAATANPNAISEVPTVPATPAIQARDIGDFYSIQDSDEIGKGAFSRVVTGFSKLPQSGGGAPPKRAIKVMQMTALNDRKVMAMMAHEKEILRRTRHPAILQLFETITTQDKVFMVMELCKGDLFEFTVGRRRKLNEIQCAQVMKQLLSAVAYLHSINIVHRDIKLENILVNDWNDIRLADFGLSKIIRDPNADVKSTPCGTGFYIAVEVLNSLDSGYGGITPLVTTSDKVKMLDLWSCGVTMYILLCGRPPFSGAVKTADERRELIAKIDRGVLFPDQHWAHISSDAKDLIMKLLARNPDVRITAAAAEQHQWFGLQKRKLDEYYAHKAAMEQQQKQQGGGGGGGAAPQGPIVVTPAHLKAGQEQQQQEQQKQQASKAQQQQQQQQQHPQQPEESPASPAGVPTATGAEAEKEQAEIRNQVNALQGGLRDDAEEQDTGNVAAAPVVAGTAPSAAGKMMGGPPPRRGRGGK